MKKNEVAKRISELVNPDKQNLQISDRTIDEVLDTLMPIVKEDETLDDFVARITPIFETIAGNIRKEKADFVKSYKKEGKPDADEPDVEEEDEEVEVDETDDDTKKMLKTLMEEVRGLKESNSLIQKGRTAEIVKKELFKKASKLYPPSIVEVASMDFDFSSETASEKFDAKLGQIANSLNIKPSNQKADVEPDFKDFFKKSEGNESFDNL